MGRTGILWGLSLCPCMCTDVGLSTHVCTCADRNNDLTIMATSNCHLWYIDPFMSCCGMSVAILLTQLA